MIKLRSADYNNSLGVFGTYLKKYGDDDQRQQRYYTVTREQEVAGEKRPDLRLHSSAEALGKVPVLNKLADMTHWKGDQLVNAPNQQISNQYPFEASSHTGIHFLVNASRPRQAVNDRKTKKVKRSAFRKTVCGDVVNFVRLVSLVQERCTAENRGLDDGKMVVSVPRDISDKSSDSV